MSVLPLFQSGRDWELTGKGYNAQNRHGNTFNFTPLSTAASAAAAIHSLLSSSKSHKSQASHSEDNNADRRSSAISEVKKYLTAINNEAEFPSKLKISNLPAPQPLRRTLSSNLGSVPPNPLANPPLTNSLSYNRPMPFSYLETPPSTQPSYGSGRSSSWQAKSGSLSSLNEKTVPSYQVIELDCLPCIFVDVPLCDICCICWKIVIHFTVLTETSI